MHDAVEAERYLAVFGFSNQGHQGAPGSIFRNPIALFLDRQGPAAMI